MRSKLYGRERERGGEDYSEADMRELERKKEWKAETEKMNI
jgi:hypothetical protein